MKANLKYYLKDPLVLLQSKLRLKLSNETPILVYTMAKVGSLSIYSSIKKQTYIPCFHVHSLNIAEHKAAKKLCFDEGMLPGSRSPSSLIHNQIIKPNKSCKIITVFRDPIERNLSAFFDAFEYYIGTSPKNYRGSISELIDCYHNKLPHNYAIEWFDEIFERDTGINLYQKPFDKTKSFEQYQQGKYELLVMNSAIDNRLKANLIRAFIGTNSFQLENVNITEESSKGTLYKAFKKKIRFNKKYLDNLLQSKYSQHFFSSDEIEGAYKKWLK